MMKLIVGLGNPGEKYASTRHNVGFSVIDEVAKKMEVKLTKNNFEGIYYQNQDFILAKPLTFMNLSGEFVSKIANYYNIEPQNILVIRDDLDIPLGQVKLRLSGGSGGHNGMKNIIEKLQNNNINQMKIGIGRPSDSNISIKSYVLGTFNHNEFNIINKIISEAANAVISSIYNGFKNTMNNFYKGGDK